MVFSLFPPDVTKGFSQLIRSRPDAETSRSTTLRLFAPRPSNLEDNASSGIFRFAPSSAKLAGVAFFIDGRSVDLIVARLRLDTELDEAVFSSGDVLLDVLSVKTFGVTTTGDSHTHEAPLELVKVVWVPINFRSLFGLGVDSARIIGRVASCL